MPSDETKDEAIPETQEESSVPVVGDFAPDFALPDERGETVHLRDLLGKQVILYFYPKDC